MEEKVYVCIVLLFLIACGRKDEQENRDRTQSIGRECLNFNIDQLKSDSVFLYSFVFDSVSVVVLENNAASMIGGVDQIKLKDNLFVILDSRIAKGIFVFDRSGRFVRKIGKLGKGPGEYFKPVSFCLDSHNRIHILDLYLKKIIQFDISGKWEGDLNLPRKTTPFQLEQSDGIFYVDRQLGKHEKSGKMLYGFDLDNGVVNEKFDNSYNRGLQYGVNYSQNFFKFNDNVRYIKPLFDTIFNIEGRNIVPYIAISTENQFTPREIGEFNKSKDLMGFLDEFKFSKRFKGAFNYVENESLIKFCFNCDMRNYELFYWKHSKEIVVTSRWLDDFLHLSKPIKFCDAKGDRFIAVIEDRMGTKDQFIQNIENDNVNWHLVNCSKNELKKVDLNSNPIILIYNVREDCVKSD